VANVAILKTNSGWSCGFYAMSQSQEYSAVFFRQSI